MHFIDTVAVDKSSIRKTADGFALFTARVARGGNVQLYLGDEIGRPDMPVVRVYRPPEQVFRQDAMASYSGVPITIGHPKDGVTAANWKDVARGEVGEDIVRDGEFVRVPMMLRDQRAIEEVERGIRELSAGYSAEITFADGVSPTGEPYDAYMTDLKQNHVAIVKAARGGAELRIGDEQGRWGAAPVSDARIGDGRTPGDQDRGANNPPTEKSTMSNTNTRTVMVDGLSVETTDAGAQAIMKLQQQVKDSGQALTDAQVKHQAELADRDAKLAKAEAERDDAKAKVLSDADLDARVQARADLVTSAKAIHDADYTGKSQAYIDARFDILAEDAKKDPVTRALRDGATTRNTVNDNGYAESVAAFNRNQQEA